MTLCIAVLTREGVVLTAESLGTLQSTIVSQLTLPCDKCGKEVEPTATCPECGTDLGPVPPLEREMPTTHTFHCQKLFKLNKWTGVAFAGGSEIKQKKMQYWVYDFLNWIKGKNAEDQKVERVIDHFMDFLDREKILVDFQGSKIDLMFAGISRETNRESISFTFNLGPNGFKQVRSIKYGVNPIGVYEILDSMFGQGGIQQYPIAHFPLQDAVEFAEFLMQTQIGYDRYTNRIPRVGGDIDIAVIHPIFGFKWVRQKKLQGILEQE